MRFIVILLLSGLGFNALCQKNQDKTLILNSNNIDETRYKDIKRSPYLYNEFTYGSLLGKDGSLVDSILINYNGYSQEFEYKKAGGGIIELDSRYYFKATIISDDYNASILHKFDSDTTVFTKGLNVADSRKFYVEVYKSKNVIAFKEFLMTLAVNEVQTVGSTVSFKYFSPKSFYYMTIDGSPVRFLLKKKSVLGVLDNKEVAAFVKKEKLRMFDEVDLKKALEFYDSTFE